MKKALLTAMVLGAFLFDNETKAQVSFGLNVNIGGRAGLGAAVSDNRYEGQYYYLPEIDMYYDIVGRRFIYLEGNRWAYASELPAMYRGYDLARAYKVTINEYKPYLHASEYRERYHTYYDNFNHRAQGTYDRGAQGRGQDEGYYSNRNGQRNEERNDQRYNDHSAQQYDNRSMQREDRYSPGRNDNQYEEKNMQRNNGFEGRNGQDQNNSYNSGNTQRAQQNGDRYGNSSNGNGQNSAGRDDAQRGSSFNNGGGRQEDVKEDHRNGTINNNGAAGGQLNNGSHDTPQLPKGNSGAGATQNSGAKDDAQRAQEFYNNGQSGRGAVRNPKFNQPGNGQDTSHGVQPGNNQGKDTLRNNNPVKGTSGQENNGTNNNRRNDHIVMAGADGVHGFPRGLQ